MRFKIDEHLPVEIKELLAQNHHDAVTVPDEGMTGAIDPDVAQVCQKEARALLTLDLSAVEPFLPFLKGFTGNEPPIDVEDQTRKPNHLPCQRILAVC